MLAVEVLLVVSASLKPEAPAIETVSEMADPAAARPLKINVTLPTIPKEKFTLVGATEPLVAGQLDPALGIQDQSMLDKPLNVAVKVALVAMVEPRLVTVT